MLPVPMRRTTVVASGALIATLALAALPVPVTSRQPSPDRAAETTTFEELDIPATLSGAMRPGSTAADVALDPAYLSDGTVTGDTAFATSSRAGGARPGTRPSVDQPVGRASSSWKDPKRTLTGMATFYDNGTTAMRLPRGTVVVICMAGGCIERVVTDYGPVAPERIVDLDREDFFAICGCPSWSGVEPVTVKVY